jgi:hypothetical protein
MKPARKRNGQLACGCRPYHEYGEEFYLCREGKRLYKAALRLNLSTPEGAAANHAYLDHIGLEAEVQEVAA